ncbi:glycosyltransferase [Methylobacterium sp. NEAU 140]|uniref:nucleotide disphospho-sugar-binding domain-containing protein n=1 Tax=Methylobacterium sp. NEAU 140 TaxID=3064945 RepID=UPI002736F22D|nr:nucleotide disphospho-sugar-binding domain-containing protein [Methylobacterium sp. NEAU 140]MDP4025239.1 glycosyltransferase [Methylobacterium sp. NEAU 140]
MDIRLVALGSHGDVLPFIALGAELSRRGHGVTLAAPAPFAALAGRAGLAFHPLGTAQDYDRHNAEPDLWHPRRGVAAGFRYYAAMIEPTYRWLAQTARPGSGIVVASTLGLGARVAQDKLGLPLATVHVMPVMVESRHAPPVLPAVPLSGLLPAWLVHRIGRFADRYVIGPAALPSLNALRAELGLPPVRRLRHWWNLGTRVVLMFPDWYAPPQPDWPANAVQVGFPVADRFGEAATLPDDLAAFLEAGEPPLAFTYGSGMRQAGPFFDTAVRLCRRTGRRGVLLAPQDGQVAEDLPPGMIRTAYAPLSLLLPRCAALVHHGGVGTVARALAAGVPQLIVPVALDHFDEAQRVTRLGVGTALSRRRFTAGRAERALARLTTDPAVAAACATARTRMAGDDGVITACDAIEALSERHGSR